MANLLDLGGNAVNTQQDHQAGEPGVERLFFRISRHRIVRSFGTDQFSVPIASSAATQTRRKRGRITDPRQLSSDRGKPRSRHAKDPSIYTNSCRTEAISLPAGPKLLSLIVNFEIFLPHQAFQKETKGPQTPLCRGPFKDEIGNRSTLIWPAKPRLAVRSRTSYGILGLRSTETSRWDNASCPSDRSRVRR